MKRRLVIILIFLLAGALVNVLVAYGAFLRCRSQNPARTVGVQAPDPAEIAWWRHHRPPDLDNSDISTALRLPSLGGVVSEFMAGDAVKVSERGVVRLSPSSDPLVLVVRVAVGFPLHTASGFRYSVTPSTIPAPLIITQLSMNASTLSSAQGIPTPDHPIWPGVVVNTIFYAAILWPLICGPFVFRRLIRRRRGVCPACAYPIGGAAVCSECGKPLPNRAVA
jgi:hypothetical protein